MRRPPTPVALLVALVVLLTGCGGDDPATSTESHNAADVEFATGMIPHHAQALHMVEMAEGRGSSSEFGDLLADIEEAQGPEIEQMAGWLEAWDEEVPATEMPMGAGHGDAHGMGDPSEPGMGMGSGMMSSRQLDRLDRAPQGEAFERMWLRMMIEHHEGAVEMAETEVADGSHPDAIGLAEDIIEAQEAEIELMEDLLRG